MGFDSQGMYDATDQIYTLNANFHKYKSEMYICYRLMRLYTVKYCLPSLCVRLEDNCGVQSLTVMLSFSH